MKFLQISEYFDPFATSFFNWLEKKNMQIIKSVVQRRTREYSNNNKSIDLFISKYLFDPDS